MSDAKGEMQGRSRREATRVSLVLSVVTMVIAMIRNIALVPVYLHFVSVELYGAWLATGASLAALIVSDFGLAGVIGQRTAAAYGAGDRAGVGRAIGTGLFASGLVCVLMMALALAVAPVLPAVLSMEGADAVLVAECFAIVSVASGVALIGLSFGSVLRSLQRTAAPGLAEVFAEILALGVTVGLLFAGWGLVALPLGLAARALCLFVVNTAALAVVCRKQLGIRLKIQYSIKETRWLWRDSWFQCITSIAMRAQMSAQPLLVGAILGTSAAAVFGVTHCAITTANMFASRLGGAFLPAFTHLVGEGSRDRCRTVLGQFLSANALLASVVMGGVLAFNETFVSLWVGAELYGGDLLTFLLVAAAILDAFMGAPYSAVYAGGGFHRLARVMVLAVAVQIGVAVGLLSFGIWGAAVGALAASILRVAMLSHYARESLEVEATDRRSVHDTLGLLVPGTLLGAVVAWWGLPGLDTWVAFGLAVAGFVGLTSGLHWLTGRERIARILRPAVVG